jgi:hypothetical protein
MGNPDKWIEIVTLNNLKSPYIDEDGFYLDLLSNGEGRRFTVDNSEKKLYIGQKILLQSNTINIFSRVIIDIEELNETTHLISVDGDQDLEKLKISEQAKLKGYLSGTINSQNQIYIPISAPSEEDDRIKEIPTLEPTQLNKLAKVDFLLTENNDIALDTLGDFRLSTGLNNLIQTLKMKIRTKKGALLKHPDYGLGLEYGISIADIETGIILDEFNKLIQEDPRFNSIKRMSIKLNGSNLAIDLAVTLANDSGVLPISFDISV